MQQSLATVHLAMTKQNKTSDKSTNWPVLKTMLTVSPSLRFMTSKPPSSYPSVHQKDRRDSCKYQTNSQSTDAC